MNSRLCCNPAPHPRATEMRAKYTATVVAGFFLALLVGVCAPHACADAPAWMHALTSVPIPAHDEKTDAVLLYSEQIVSVQSADKVRTTVREAYKILRPNGREYGTVTAGFNSLSKISNLHGWCIPAQGKDYEVKDKEAVDISLPMIDGSELISDVKERFLRIPAADPGNIVGYEYEVEEHPLVLQDAWLFQQTVPTREARYTLQLPSGWEYKTTWLNYNEVKPSSVGANQWQWIVSDVKEIRPEEDMPPWRSIAGHMVVNFVPPGGGVTEHSFQDWRQMGLWYQGLIRGRQDTTPEMKARVAQLTAGAKTPLDKMRAIAKFLQTDVRYVAISLGIGGWQPHAAPEVFQHRYGDCKDKVTLMSAMLREAGIESYYVIINTDRGGVSAQTPAQAFVFNHVVLAVKIPDGVNDPSLVATIQHPKLGKLLFFDPTNTYVPFGELGGYLQENYGVLVSPDGGELIPLPKQEPIRSGIARTGKAVLDLKGVMQGSFTEVHRGDNAWEGRERLKSVSKDTERIKPIETLVSHSLPNFTITKATVVNAQDTDLPFGYEYTVIANNYVKPAGDMLLVRPRLLGNMSSGLLETKDPRKFPVNFEGPAQFTDTFEITLPAGYEVDELPPPMNLDYSFASYQSKTEANGNLIRYTRKMEIKELTVPMSKMEELKKFYRMINSDERGTAVLKPKA